MQDSPLTQQGIEAFKAGNREEAVRLLSSAIRQNDQDEEAWLYLGAALTDPARRRQAFQKVLQINPDNEKAKNALTRLDAAAGAASDAGPTVADTAAKFGTEASQRLNEMGKLMGDAWSGKQGIKIPVEIQGAPERVTVPEMINNGQARAKQGLQIFQTQNFELIIEGAKNTTMWDVVFIGIVGVVAVGLAVLIGGWIGWPLTGFLGGLWGIFRPILQSIVQMVATAAGFAGAIYASRYYLQNQNINVSLQQHGMYYAQVWLPVTLVNAAMTFVVSALGFLVLCLSPIVLIVGIALLVYSWFLLKGAFDRIYGTANNRGLITAAIAVLGGWLAAGIVSFILVGLFRLA